MSCALTLVRLHWNHLRTLMHQQQGNCCLWTCGWEPGIKHLNVGEVQSNLKVFSIYQNSIHNIEIGATVCNKGFSGLNPCLSPASSWGRIFAEPKSSLHPFRAMWNIVDACCSATSVSFSSLTFFIPSFRFIFHSVHQARRSAHEDENMMTLNGSAPSF